MSEAKGKATEGEKESPPKETSPAKTAEELQREEQAKVRIEEASQRLTNLGERLKKAAEEKGIANPDDVFREGKKIAEKAEQSVVKAVATVDRDHKWQDVTGGLKTEDLQKTAFTVANSLKALEGKNLDLLQELMSLVEEAKEMDSPKAVLDLARNKFIQKKGAPLTSEEEALLQQAARLVQEMETSPILTRLKDLRSFVQGDNLDETQKGVLGHSQLVTPKSTKPKYMDQTQ